MLGARKFLKKQIKTYLNLFEILPKIVLPTTLSPDNYIETLSTNQGMKWSSGTRIINSPQPYFYSLGGLAREQRKQADNWACEIVGFAWMQFLIFFLTTERLQNEGVLGSS